jgi:hypothetical protein
MPGSSANIDHIVLVPSGVWVVDSKRVRGRIKIDDKRDGAQKLSINGDNRTELVHKLTGQVNAVTAVVAELAPRVPVHGAFCFWLPISRKRDFITVPDSGLPMLSVWTINGYPLWHRRQMVRQLNAAGTLSAKHAEELGELLAARFPSAAGKGDRSARPRSIPPPQSRTPMPPTARTPSSAGALGGRAPSSDMTTHVATEPAPPPPEATTRPGWVTKQEYKTRMEAQQMDAWETARTDVQAALGCPVPALLSDRLRHDSSTYCHHTLWHSRVYLTCVHGQVGHTVLYTTAASVVGAHHSGRAGTPQWRALTAFTEHLREQGYVDFEGGADSRVENITVLADLQNPPRRLTDPQPAPLSSR